jgi:hypothetical protein
MRFNGVILKEFSVLDDEIARLRTLGSVTVQQLELDHFLKHGVERSL